MSSKAELRRWLHAQRQAMSDGVRQQAGRRLAERGLAWAAERTVPPSSSLPPGTAGRIAAYLSVGAEPPTLALMALLVERGYEVLVPVCEPGFRLLWVRWMPGIAQLRSPWAPVDEPVGRREPLAIMEQVSGILLPALAADTEGNRLGKGGGYYDRFLASLDGLEHRPSTAAVVYDHELLGPGRIVVDELDAPVSGVLTPERYLGVAASAP